MSAADEVLDYFKKNYWPARNACNQTMAIIQHGRIDSKRVEEGLAELVRRGLVAPGAHGAESFCLTDAGKRAIGAIP